jgi:hypothetical protein
VLLVFVHLSRRGLDERLDFVDFIFGEVQITSAHDSLCLRRIAGSDDGAAHGGITRRPGNSDFADRPLWRSHALDQRQIVRVLVPLKRESSRNADVGVNGGTNSDCHRACPVREARGGTPTLHSVETCPAPPMTEPFIATQIAGIFLTRRFGSYGLLATGVF